MLSIERKPLKMSSLGELKWGQHKIYAMVDAKAIPF